MHLKSWCCTNIFIIKHYITLTPTQTLTLLALLTLLTLTDTGFLQSPYFTTVDLSDQ